MFPLLFAFTIILGEQRISYHLHSVYQPEIPVKINHIAILAGDSVIQELNKVSPGALAVCRSLLPKGGRIPGAPVGFSVRISDRRFVVTYNDAPVVCCAVGGRREREVCCAGRQGLRAGAASSLRGQVPWGNSSRDAAMATTIQGEHS